jgi:Protein of unknown function (DUF3040)
VTDEPDGAGFVMLSGDDCRTLAEIERRLQEDPVLRRAFGAGARATSRLRRLWQAFLLTALVLTVGMVALHVTGAAFESAALALIIGTGLRRTSDRAGPRAGRGSAADRRP